MSEKLERLRKEMRAELALTWAGQADCNRRLEEISSRIHQHADRIDEQAQQIDEQGRQIAEQGRQIAEQGSRIRKQGHLIGASMRETARLGREVAAGGDQIVGRLRQFDQRFGVFIDALQEDLEEKAPLSRLERLEERVKDLEERSGPAA